MTGSETKKKILIAHRYFWPQPYPYALLLKDLIDELRSEFHFEIFTTGSDEDQMARCAWAQQYGIVVTTINLPIEKNLSMAKKAALSLYYSMRLHWHALRSDAEIIQIATTPPVVPAMLVRLASYLSSKRYIYHCQDIYPEALVVGNVKSAGALTNFLKRIDKKNVATASKVIVLSHDMLRTLAERGVKTDNISVINNSYLGSVPVIEGAVKRSEIIKVVFAGSLGRFQNLDNLVQAIAQVDDKDRLEFLFIGDGVKRKSIEDYCQSQSLNNVRFLGQQSFEDTQKMLLDCDFGIISLAPHIIDYAYPSKTSTYLVNGLKLIAIVEPESELAQFVVDNDIGLVSEGDSVDAISDVFASVLDKNITDNLKNPSEIQDIAIEFFGKEHISQQWKEIYHAA